MAKTTIKQDTRSLFVRTNGSIYRPVPTPHADHAPRAVGTGYGDDARDTSGFVALQPVDVTNISQTAMCRVRDEHGHEEWWHSHGQYTSSTAEVWNPAPPRVRLSAKESRAFAESIGLEVRQVSRCSSSAVTDTDPA